jgi:hypothetical protein
MRNKKGGAVEECGVEVESAGVSNGGGQERF